MNKARRKEIEVLIAKAEDLKAKVEELRDAVENLRDEEQEYYDNMPESLQGGDKGEAANMAVEHLQNAYDDLDAAATNAEDTIAYLQSATE